MLTVSETDAAYIAGFFDGEGCVTHQWRNNSPSISLRFAQKNPKVLEHIQGILGCGKLYPHGASGSWVLGIFGKDEIRRVIKIIYPYSKVKKRQLYIAYAICTLTNKRGNKILSQYKRDKRFELVNELKAEKAIAYVI